MPHQSLQTKHDLHVFDGSHESWHERVRNIQKLSDSLKVLDVSGLHDPPDLCCHHTDSAWLFKGQKMPVTF